MVGGREWLRWAGRQPQEHRDLDLAVDAAILRLARRKPRTAPQVNPAAVEWRLQPSTSYPGWPAALLALNLTKSEDVVLTVVQIAQHSPPGTGGPGSGGGAPDTVPQLGQLTLTWVCGESVPAGRRPAPTDCGRPGGGPANSLTRMGWACIPPCPERRAVTHTPTVAGNWPRSRCCSISPRSRLSGRHMGCGHPAATG